MLNKSTVEVGVNLSEAITDRGVHLVPKQNTLIGELSNAVNNATHLAHSSYLMLQSVKIDIEVASTGSVVQVTRGEDSYSHSEHDTYMDNYIDSLASLVSGHLDFSRNVVNKEVIKFTESLQENINSYKYREAEDFFNVSYYKLPDVFNLDIIAGEIPNYIGDSKSTKYGIDSINTMGLEGDENFVKHLLTGIEEEDSIISGWFTSLGVNGKHYILTNVNVFGMDLPSQINYHLANYLFYRNLVTNTDAITNESVPVITRKAINNRDYHAASLAQALTVYKSLVKSGKLLASNDLTFSYFSDKQIDLIVYEESFAKLAEAGLTIETVFGYISSSGASSSVTVSEIVNKGVDYADRWAKTRSLYLIHLNDKRLDIFKHLLRQAFESSVASPETVTEAEKEFYNQDPNFLKETVEQANKYIDEITADCIEDINCISLELVAKIRFRFSNAYEILAKMKELMAGDDKLEPMEAALYSVVSYLTDYCLEQVDVVKFN